MRYTEPTQTEGIEPIFVSVKEAAKILAISPWSMYQLCYDDEVASQFQGRRRLVSVESLREYAKNLPTKAATTTDEDPS